MSSISVHRRLARNMNSGWIGTVYNNSDKIVNIRCKNDSDNGVMVDESNPSDNFNLADGQFHELKPHTKYSTEWFRIPWFYNGKHYKTYSADYTINFFQCQFGRFDYIMFVNDANGKVLMRQRVPSECDDYHCIMRFENDGVCIDIVHCNSAVDQDLVREVLDESGEWVKASAPVTMNAVRVFDKRNSLEEQEST